jgi:tRNA(adenine34) deaminase
MTRDERLMALAMQQADLAHEAGEIPVGAVIARGDEVIAVGHNRRELDGDPTAHAEVVAIRAAAKALGRRRLGGCTLYVTLEPCPMCAGAIVMAGLDRVVYGAADPKQGCTGTVYRITEDPAFTHYCPADGGVLAEACQAQLDAFFRSAREKQEAQ